MPAKTIPYSIMLPVMALIALCLNGCGIQATKEPTIEVTPTEVPISTTTKTNAPEPTNTLLIPRTSPPTLAQVHFASSTPKPTSTLLTTRTSTPTLAQAPFAGPIIQNGTLPAITWIVPSSTIEPTSQAVHATAQAIYDAERTVIVQAWNDQTTQIAQFPIACEHAWFLPNSISPDGKWSAIECDPNQTLIVQNKYGTKWVLEFTDFLNPDTPAGMPGALYPKFWGMEGRYLYFTTVLGYEGGGNQCFPLSRGQYSLVRLDLKTGLRTTIVPFEDSFPGNEIEFSPNGRYYAITLGGLTITDLKMGEVTHISAPGEMKMIWSPDSKHLAYSVASCGEFYVQSSSVYVWDAATGQSQILFTTEGILLSPESWIDNSTLRILGDQIVDQRDVYTIYEYNLNQENFTFTGTATPYP